MAEQKEPAPGSIAWHDLTVPDAERIRDFYADVVGWKPSPISMGDYDDFSMLSPDGNGAAGICHARGANLGIPPQWLIYIIVEDVAAAVAKCASLGGKLIHGPRSVGGQQFAIIQDPAGAVAGLYGK